jgi:hypothetical protein
MLKTWGDYLTGIEAGKGTANPDPLLWFSTLAFF